MEFNRNEKVDSASTEDNVDALCDIEYKHIGETELSCKERCVKISMDKETIKCAIENRSMLLGIIKRNKKFRGDNIKSVEDIYQDFVTYKLPRQSDYDINIVANSDVKTKNVRDLVVIRLMNHIKSENNCAIKEVMRRDIKKRKGDNYSDGAELNDIKDEEAEELMCKSELEPKYLVRQLVENRYMYKFDIMIVAYTYAVIRKQKIKDNKIMMQSLEALEIIKNIKSQKCRNTIMRTTASIISGIKDSCSIHGVDKIIEEMRKYVYNWADIEKLILYLNKV